MSENESVKVRSGLFKKSDFSDILVKGEQVVERAVIHPGIYWHSLAVAVLSVLVGLYVWELGALLAVTALIMFAYATIKKEILFLVLTNKRVLVRYGILQVDVVDMRFSKIESLELERMLPGYLMGYANVVIMGTGQRYMTVPFVGNASLFRQAYNRLTLEKDDAALEENDA